MQSQLWPLPFLPILGCLRVAPADIRLAIHVQEGPL